MTKTFKKVPKVKTVDFGSLAAGDYFCYENTYYIKLIREYKLDSDPCYYNSMELKSGTLTFFYSGTRVKPYKDCEVILYE